MIHLNLIFHVVVSNNLKLAPVPCATSKWPITRLRCRINETQIYLVNKVVDISASSVISWPMKKLVLCSVKLLQLLRLELLPRDWRSSAKKKETGHAIKVTSRLFQRMLNVVKTDTTPGSCVDSQNWQRLFTYMRENSIFTLVFSSSESRKICDVVVDIIVVVA